jgi:hypothetical protein
MLLTEVSRMLKTSTVFLEKTEKAKDITAFEAISRQSLAQQVRRNLASVKPLRNAVANLQPEPIR